MAVGGTPQGSCAGRENLCAHRKSGASKTPGRVRSKIIFSGEDTLTVCSPFMSRSRSRQPTLLICNLSATSQPPCRTGCDETQSTRKGSQLLDQPGRRIAMRQGCFHPRPGTVERQHRHGEPATRADRSHCSATRANSVASASAGVICRDRRLPWYTRTPTGVQASSRCRSGIRICYSCP
jgi:hypothetical protein